MTVIRCHEDKAIADVMRVTQCHAKSRKNRHTFHFHFLLMEVRAAHDIYYYLTEGKIPEYLKGNKNKNKLKSWKKRAMKIELRIKDDKKELTFLNSTFVLIRRGKFKIIVRKNELQAIWK